MPKEVFARKLAWKFPPVALGKFHKWLLSKLQRFDCEAPQNSANFIFDAFSQVREIGIIWLISGNSKNITAGARLNPDHRCLNNSDMTKAINISTMKHSYTILNMMTCEQTAHLTPSLSESISSTSYIRLGTPHTNSHGNGTDGSARHQTPPTTSPWNTTTPSSLTSFPPCRTSQPSNHGVFSVGVERD